MAEVVSLPGSSKGQLNQVMHVGDQKLLGKRWIGRPRRICIIASNLQRNHVTGRCTKITYEKCRRRCVMYVSYVSDWYILLQLYYTRKKFRYFDISIQFL